MTSHNHHHYAPHTTITSHNHHHSAPQTIIITLPPTITTTMHHQPQSPYQNVPSLQHCPTINNQHSQSSPLCITNYNPLVTSPSTLFTTVYHHKHNINTHNHHYCAPTATVSTTPVARSFHILTAYQYPRMKILSVTYTYSFKFLDHVHNTVFAEKFDLLSTK